MRRGWAALSALCVIGACGERMTQPSDSVIVTFRVVDEMFRVRLTTDAQIEAARFDGGRYCPWSAVVVEIRNP